MKDLNDHRARFACCIAADDPDWHRAELARLWSVLGEGAAWAVADEHELVSVAPVALQRAGVSPPARWVHRANQVRGRLSLYMAELDRAAGALRLRGIPLVALKNAGIARGVYPDLAGCPMGDVDVLVQPERFRDAHQCLLGLGYALASRSPLGEKDLPEAEMSGGTEYQCRLSDGSALWFELQWRPVGGRWIRDDQEPSAGDLIARATPIPGSPALLLAPNDNLLQVCLHTAKHSYVRAPGFRLHTDVDRIVRRCQVDWDGFVATVRRLEVCTAVYFSLLLPARLLRTPVPESVLTALAPRRWKLRWIERSLERAGLFHPAAPKWSKLGYIAFNLMLYDSITGARRAVFPDYATMRQRYGATSRWTLPWRHARRIAALALKRTRT